MPVIGHSICLKMLHGIESIAKWWVQLVEYKEKDGTLIANDMLKKNKIF